MTTAIAEQNKANMPPVLPADASSPSVNIAVSRIVPSPWNRKAKVTDDLIESVRQNGVLQNVILRPHKATEEDVALYSMKADPFIVGDSIFQLVAGERRWGAARKAGRSHVPAAIRHLSDIDAMRLQIDENEDRENLSPMERAEAYDRLRMLYQQAHAKDKDYTEAKAIEAVAADRKCSSRTVYDVISLKKLTQNAQHALRNGEMESSHGSAMSGRSPEEQEKLLLWLRQQTHHSQGDVPSVRRLKLEIRQLDIAAEENKRQDKLFKDPQPGTATTKVPTVAEALYPKALEVVKEVGEKVHKVSAQLLMRRLHIDLRPAQELLARMEKEKLVGPEIEGGFRQYIFPKTAPAQTFAPAPKIGTPEKAHEAVNKAIAAYKPPTKAQLKAEEKERKKEAKAQRDRQRNNRIDSKYKASLFAGLASKATINSRLLTHVVPDLLLHVMDDQLPIEAFAQDVLKWPPPRNGNDYTIDEVKLLSRKHTRKFTSSLLAAMVIVLFNGQSQVEKLARYFSVDTKKLRLKAAAAVKDEEAKARLPKVPTTQKEKQLHCALHHVADADKRWSKLRRTGASNPELRAAIAYEFGEAGASTGSHGRVAFMGGQNPVVFFNSSNWGRDKKPSLEGVALVAAVRDLLKIPEKGDVDA